MPKKIAPAFPVAVIRWELINPDAEDECRNTMAEYYALQSAEAGFTELMREQLELNHQHRPIHEAWLRGQAVFKSANVRIVADRFSEAFRPIMQTRIDCENNDEEFKARCWAHPDVQSWISRAPLGRRYFIGRVIDIITKELHMDMMEMLFKEKMAYSWMELQERAVNKARHSEQDMACRRALSWMCLDAHEPLTHEAVLDIFYGISDSGADPRRRRNPPLFDRDGNFLDWSDKENSRWNESNG